MILSLSRTTLPPCADVLGMPVHRFDLASFIGTISTRAVYGLPTRMAYLNAHTFNLSAENPRLRRLLAEADILYADGMSVVWASRLFGPGLPERLSLSTFVVDLMQAFADREVTVFLMGGKPGVSNAAAARLREQVPHLRIVGTANGYGDTRNADDLVRRINAAAPDVLLVGMGTPTQEEWIATYGPRLDVPVQWAVGAMFDYLAGDERHPPAWMCRAGLQWLYRLAVDPLGKWRRYLLGNPVFLKHVVAGVFGRRCRKGHPCPILRGGESS
jgi:N-acetylglucosaminyldiphosphoundecaprenol N-acetyl-beta-D-mannosaminyltransferase